MVTKQGTCTFGAMETNGGKYVPYISLSIGDKCLTFHADVECDTEALAKGLMLSVYSILTGKKDNLSFYPNPEAH